MSEILDAYWAAPPMARTLATAIVVTSISVHFGFLSYSWFYFTEDRLFRLPPEIWRLATNFFLSGAKMGIIMDPYFAYQYLKQLETTNPKFPRKEDVLWYLITVGGFIIVGSSHFFSAPSRRNDNLVYLPAWCYLTQPLRFLETRKITPVCRPARHSHKYKGSVGVRAWWDVFWMTRVVLSVRSSGYLAPYISASNAWWFLGAFSHSCLVRHEN
jgi:hypothetical protein